MTLRLAAAFAFLFGALPNAAAAAPAPQAEPQAKSRLFVLTDIEADPDDAQSLVRLLLYANDFDLEGLVATTSVHQKARVAPQSITRIMGEYAKVRKNLALHDLAYPTAAKLAALVGTGQTVYGMAGVGEGQDTAGSARIIAALEKSDERPLWVAVWGGPNTLAQALYTIRASRSPAEAKRLISKLRVYTISDQDDSGQWIRKEYPEVFYMVSPGGYSMATWIGMNQTMEGIDNATISNPWLAEHIQQGHGPLGAAYPDVAYGMEGDTPSFLGLIPNGLNVPERPDWGGWGGRYTLRTPSLTETDPKGFNGGVPVSAETRPIWTNAIDKVTPFGPKQVGGAIVSAGRSYTGFRETLWRWLDDFQNDFAARMDWSVKAPAEANHPPVVRLPHPERLAIRSDESTVLSALGTTDPDGDSLSYRWFSYPEAGTCTVSASLSGAENLYERAFKAPDVSAPCEMHFILRVTDKGSPPLSRYRRVIITINPR